MEKKNEGGREGGRESKMETKTENGDGCRDWMERGRGKENERKEAAWMVGKN